MGVQGSCHCGSVRLMLSRAPAEVTACDCSLCSRRGMLWAEYAATEAATAGNTEPYSFGDKNICFCHCPKCGCTTHWHSIGGERRIGVNARLIDGFEEKGVGGSFSFGDGPVATRHLQGANG
jgi:hypothetical protein